jgi:hypothetical protein
MYRRSRTRSRNGRNAGPLARTHAVFLSDIYRYMLDEAARRWPDLELVRADARELPFGEGEFDAVLALDLISPWWTLAYPSYVNWRPKRLAVTMLAGGVLPEWRASVSHHRADEVRRAIDVTGLRLQRRLAFGPFWSAKWHLWWTVAP